MAGKHWLIKSEPSVYSIEDLARDGTTEWSGVRNYKARNYMRDEMRPGDGLLFYHSNADPLCIAGIAEVASAAHADSTQFREGDHYYDPDSDRENPRWWCVDVRHVEKVLGDYPGIGLRAVVGEGERLIAFYVLQPNAQVELALLRDFLRARLPSYMVPDAFVLLEDVPRLPNGKLNRRALTVSERELQQSDAYVAAESSTEQTLCKIWADVLEVPVDTMPGWLQEVVGRNPVTLLARASRGLMHGEPGAGADVISVLIASAAIVLVAAPIAMRLYRKER